MDIDTEEDEEVEQETHTKVIDGVEYNYNPETNMIIDASDFSEMGEWEEEDNSINFEDEESEEKHNQYKQN